MKLLAATLLCFCALSLSASAVTILPPGPVNRQITESFNSVPLGPLPAGSPVLSMLNLQSLTATISGTGTDNYDLRPGSSRALAADGGGLYVVDPGQGIGPLPSSFDFRFLTPITTFGFSIADHSPAAISAEFYAAGALVDSIALTPSADPNDVERFLLALASEVDQVVIEQSPDNGLGLGFVLDDLTLVPVPEPASTTLLALFALTVGLRRRR